MTYPSQVVGLLIGKQTDFETAATPTKDAGLVLTSLNPSLSAEVQESQGIGDLETLQVTDGVLTPSLNVEGEFQHGRLLEYVFGSVAHAETTGDWKHTYTVSGETPYLTAEIGHSLTAGDATLELNGLAVNSATIRSAINERVTLSVDLQGKAASTGATAETIVQSTLPVFSHDLVSVTINGVAATEVQDIEISFTKSLAASSGLGSLSPQQLHPAEFKVAYNATLGFSAKTYHDLMVNRTSHAVVFDAKNGTALGSGQRQLYVSLQDATLNEASSAVQVGSLVFVSISGVARLNEAYSVDNISSATW